MAIAGSRVGTSTGDALLFVTMTSSPLVEPTRSASPALRELRFFALGAFVNELLIWFTAFCVAEKTDVKKLPEPAGWTKEPPGVFASSMAGVNGFTILPNPVVADLNRRVEVASGGEEGADRVPRSPRTSLLASLFGVVNGDGVCGTSGVGGVTNVDGVSYLFGRGEIIS